MLVESFNSINIKKELTDLIGISSLETKNNFLNCPSSRINKIFKEMQAKKELRNRIGNYWYTKGPSYETPAEIKMIQRFGGDAAGMSRFTKLFLHPHLSMEVAIISCITNMASGLSNQKLSHEEVTETAALSRKIYFIIKISHFQIITLLIIYRYFN